MKQINLLLFAVFFSLLPAKLFAQEQIPADLIPMYGGMDRNSNSEIKRGDEEFRSKVTEAFGTRENAADAFIDRGFRDYYQSDLSSAMRRFNQAWLIDPENPEIYWGFASIQYDIGANCSAMKMTEHALMLGFTDPEFLADAGMMHGLCPLGSDVFSDEQKNLYFEKSNALFETAAERASTNPYIYGKWGQTLYWRGDYAGAWDRVFQIRENGGEPHPQFLDALRQKMPEPES